MKYPTKSQPKKRPTEIGTQISVRLQNELLVLLDEMRRREPDLPSRPEVIRRLVEQALDTTKKKR